MSDWETFHGGLTEALREVSDRVFLVVFSRTEPRLFVQFAGGEHELRAEATGAPFATPDQMTEAGWEPPRGQDQNWGQTLPLPALTTEYATLATRCVVALRDVQGLTGPEELVYKAWREAEWPSATTPPTERDRGENPLVLSWLGVPPARVP